jgi:2,3-bisphosphoglycerate-independent phosphoglycerate mutase
VRNKILLTIADGLGDRPCEELGWKTPLEAARKEHLNAVTQQGSSGIMDLYECGTPVGTDLGHMLLFGYKFEDYPGRGPIEAFGEHVALQAGDIAFRANFATVDEEGIIVDRRAGRIREKTKELAGLLNGMEVDGVKILFKEATEHRAVLVLRGPGLSAAITDTDPKVEGKSVKEAKPCDESEEARRTADVLNHALRLFREKLKDSAVNQERIKQGLPPANCILTRGAGMMPDLPKMTELYGFRGACVAGESTVLGVALMAGFDIITDKEMTGNLDTNVKLKASLAVDALKDHDFVCLHFKATDLMGHDNNPKGKVRAIEKYDEMIGYVQEYLKKITDSNVIIAMAADHSTPCERKEHSGDPVPIVVSGRNIRKDKVTEYDEIHCAEGGLNRMNGRMFNHFLLDYLEVIPKRGN